MKILFTVNGTPRSESIIPSVADLARRLKAEILIARGIDSVPLVSDPVAPLYSERIFEEVLQAGEKYLEGIASRFADLPTRTFCLPGSPGQSIRRLAAEEGCDLLVMASHGHTGFVRWLWGSMAEGMARVAPCPVMLLRAPAPTEFRRILVPFDGSEPSWNVMEHLTPFIDATSAQITLLHCADLNNGEDLRKADQKQVEYMLRCDLKNMAEEHPLVELETSPAAAPEGIDQWLKDNSCDLVAMSTHGRMGMAHFWNGSVTEHVARRANCPVLVFPSALVKDQVIA